MTAPVLPGRGLFYTGSLIYEEHGEDALAAWEAKLSPEQRLAMDAEADQFAAGLQELGVTSQQAADALAAIGEGIRNAS